ncbi:MAG: Piwi domain-containing protein [Candidatus Micrarchaeia archaeon]
MNKKIALNFLRLINQDFEFIIWRRLAQLNERRWEDNIKRYKLPDEKGEYKYHWVSLQEFENSTKKTISSNVNIELTKFYLYKLLKEKLAQVGIEFVEGIKRFAPYRLYIINEKTNFGYKTIWLEPYYLKSKKLFGYLIDYHFLKSRDVEFSKEIQKLSFSLDENYRSNKGYHIDKYRYITNFINEKLRKFSKLTESIEIANDLEQIEYSQLEIRKYIFRNSNESNSQFKGIEEYGPYSWENRDIKYIYIYHQNDKDYVNFFIKALNGEEFKTFGGLKNLRLPVQTKENTRGIPISSFNDPPENFLPNGFADENTIVIAIFPSKEEKFYYTLKNYCLKRDIALQGVHLETIIDENKLRWSLSGIALQILSKLGGIPWIVEAKTSNCLIIGIGQSIERDNENKPIRFLAYSILLETSGKFLTIEPLAEASDKSEYLKKIIERLPNIITEYSNYTKIVFHIPEKISLKVVRKIEETLDKINTRSELYIIRINDDSKFFGYDLNNNSLIPYESSYIRLSNREFLLWTEGLNYHNPTPRKRYANPIYIDFYYSNKEKVEYEFFLQDILNLSGANYRGFNAKSLPVSMFYPKLISNFYKHFSKYNLDTIIEKKNRMWFL